MFCYLSFLFLFFKIFSSSLNAISLQNKQTEICSDLVDVACKMPLVSSEALLLRVGSAVWLVLTCPYGVTGICVFTPSLAGELIDNKHLLVHALPTVNFPVACVGGVLILRI